ncbi:MAG: hypothetical protein CSA70_04305 [Rhodobacterales bacterium]|nr:MAG: hypothetical protein CSA70_04305 [Rhodobacterales bacterium]
MTDDDLPARLVAPGPGGQGRTSWEVTPKGLTIIEELAGRGCHLTTIAQVLGMHVATLREVRKRDPEVDEAHLPVSRAKVARAALGKAGDPRYAHWADNK